MTSRSIETKFYLGELGERECIITATASVDRSFKGYISVSSVFEQLLVWNEKAQEFLDLTEWVDTKELRQTLEGKFENAYEKELYEAEADPHAGEDKAYDSHRDRLLDEPDDAA